MRLNMTALEQHVREQQLRQKINDLKIEIDQVKRERQVREITESDYFRDLQSKVKHLRERSGSCLSEPRP